MFILLFFSYYLFLVHASDATEVCFDPFEVSFAYAIVSFLLFFLILFSFSFFDFFPILFFILFSFLFYFFISFYLFLFIYLFIYSFVFLINSDLFLTENNIQKFILEQVEENNLNNNVNNINNNNISKLNSMDITKSVLFSEEMINNALQILIDVNNYPCWVLCPTGKCSIYYFY